MLQGSFEKREENIKLHVSYYLIFWVRVVSFLSLFLIVISAPETWKEDQDGDATEDSDEEQQGAHQEGEDLAETGEGAERLAVVAVVAVAVDIAGGRNAVAVVAVVDYGRGSCVAGELFSVVDVDDVEPLTANKTWNEES